VYVLPDCQAKQNSKNGCTSDYNLDPDLTSVGAQLSFNIVILGSKLSLISGKRVAGDLISTGKERIW
jgi:hypothetical protein